MLTGWRTWLSGIVILLWASLAHAQDLPEGVRIAPAPEGFGDVYRPEGAFAKDRQTAYRLVKRRTRITPETRTFTSRQVLELRTASAVEDDGTIEISFDPASETLTFHYVRAIRDGRVVDLLKPDALIARDLEDNADAAVFDKRRSVTVLASGLRPGDTLDFAFTRSGELDSLRGTVSSYVQVGFGVPVQRYEHDFEVDDRIDVQFKAFAGAPDPVVQRKGGLTRYRMVGDDMPAYDPDADTPPYVVRFPTVQFSSFAGWGDVGDLFADNYVVTGADRAAVADIVPDIAVEHEAASARTLAALRWVQGNIRYIATNHGDGGYVPRRPATVLQRRFGDCKDVTLMLLAMLEGLDVEADPVLVNTDQKGGLFVDDLPANSFDHVLVLAELDGRTYQLDGTQSTQLGDLDRLSQTDFTKGIRMRPGASEVVDLPVEDAEWFKDLTYRFDLTVKPATLEVDLVHYADEAETTRQWIERDGVSEVAQAYLEYHQELMEGLGPVEDGFAVEIDEAAAALRISASYTLDAPWKQIDDDASDLDFVLLPWQVNTAIPADMTGTRDLPRAWPHPSRMRQTMSVKLAGTWALSDSKTVIDNPAFRFVKAQVWEPRKQVFTETTTYITKAAAIAPEDFVQVRDDLADANDEIGVILSKPVDGYLGGLAFLENENFWIFAYAAIGLVSAIVASVRGNEDLPRRSGSIFYPVSVSKFLVMNLLSMGLYAIFWFFKNWQWIRTVQNEELQPHARAFFGQFMNFSLFPRIAGYEEGVEAVDAVRIRGAQIIAVLSALVYFLGDVATRVSNRVEGMEWLLLVLPVGVLAPLPMVIQVLRYNRGNPDIVATNSRYTLWSWMFLVPLAVISLLTYAGLIAMLAMFA